MNEMKWVPGFIRLTRKTGVAYCIQIADIARFEAGTLGETEGSYLTLRGTDEERFVLEVPEHIDALIRQEWEGRVSLQAEIRRAVESGETE